MHKIFIYILLSTLIIASSSFSACAKDSFEDWLNNLKKEAIEEGISQNTLNKATKDLKPVEKIIDLDRKQPEATISFAQYKDKVLNKNRVEQGRRLYGKHKKIIDEVAKKYGVPGKYIVALWGIETSYGNNTGGFGVINALSTLAYDGRRSKFFRGELLQALKIVDQGHIDSSKMKGSWAGAMGQNQFMPSSFFMFAVDENGDGKRDIWETLPDIFASTANYLSSSGWKEDERWGRRVILPPNFSEDDIGLNNVETLEYWKKKGITMPNGHPIPVVDSMKASVVAPDGIKGSAYLVYDNYRVIMKWNKSTYFATCVGLLADLVEI